MPVWGIVLLVIFVILLAVFIGLMIFGNKLRKQQDEQQAQIDAAKQVMSMLIIDKKKMKLKDANLPKMVLEQTPKYLRGSKMPIVKAKIGPRIMTLMADPKVFDQLPVKAEVKAEVSGIYITGIQFQAGHFNSHVWFLLIAGIIPVFAGTWIGTKLVKKLPQEIFMKMTYILLLLSGVMAIV